MILKIKQKIIYEIDGVINFGYNKLLLTPQNNENQTILNWEIIIDGGFIKKGERLMLRIAFDTVDSIIVNLDDEQYANAKD